MKTLYHNAYTEYERGIMGYPAIAIIAQSGLGSVAVMLILMGGIAPIQMIQLSAVTIACMSYNAAILSQQKAKISFNLLIASALISCITILINAF